MEIDYINQQQHNDYIKQIVDAHNYNKGIQIQPDRTKLYDHML